MGFQYISDQLMGCSGFLRGWSKKKFGKWRIDLNKKQEIDRSLQEDTCGKYGGRN